MNIEKNTTAARALCSVMFVFLVSPTLVFGLGINIGPGASMSLGAGTIYMDCSDADIQGYLYVQSGKVAETRDFVIDGGGSADGGSGVIELSGDWVNNGVFTAGNSQVFIQDGCEVDTSNMIGDTTFNEFSATSTSGKELRVEGGSVQIFENKLTLRGVDQSNRLVITSSTPNVQAFFTLDPSGTQDIWAVNVQDNDADGGQLLAPGSPESFLSVDSGETQNWFLKMVGGPVNVPTLPTWTLLLLLMLFMPVVHRSRNLLIKR